MGWKNNPKIRELEPYAKNHNYAFVVVFGVVKGGKNFEINTYGQSKELCNAASEAGTDLADVVKSGYWPNFEKNPKYQANEEIDFYEIADMLKEYAEIMESPLWQHHDKAEKAFKMAKALKYKKDYEQTLSKHQAEIPPEEWLMIRIKLNKGRLPEDCYEGTGDLNREQMEEILLKWSDQGIWNYGVSARTGWLEEKEKSNGQS